MGERLKSKIANLFTLVELLVVVAIIIILIALLFPALKSAKDMARQMSCLNQMRQVNLGLLSYAGENGEYMPPVDWPSWKRWFYKDIAGRYWGNKASGNSDSTKLVYCPSLNGAANDCGGIGYNNRVGVHNGTIASCGNCIGARLPQFATPSKTFVLIDTVYAYRWETYDVSNVWGLGPGYRHLLSANLSFADGHGSKSKNAQSDYNNGVSTHLVR